MTTLTWKRISPYAGQSGIWTITEVVSCGESKFLLYRKDEIVGRFDSKESAKIKAEELEALAVKVAA